MSTPALIIGMVLVGMVFLQLLLACFGSITALLLDRRRQKVAQLLWWDRIEVANALRSQRQAQTAWSGHRKFIVDQKVMEAEGICSFYLKPRDTKPLPWFKPGQYLTFQLNLADQPKPLVRCYSLSDAPNSEYYRVTIKRALPPPDLPETPAGLGSSYFHDEVEVGAVLDVKAPSGHFVIDAGDRHPVVLVGGGVGITPVLSMFNAAAAAHSSREIWLFYGSRNHEDQIMREHLQDLCSHHENLHFVMCYSRPNDDEVRGKDYDESGHLTVEILQKYLPSNNYRYYICGPPEMMKTFPRALMDWGVPKSDVYIEAFGADSVKARQKAPVKAAEKATSTTLQQITFSHSNKKVAWDANFTSLLDFAAEHGVEIESACCAGGCGTCRVAVISGEVVYDQKPDCEVEEGNCLACVGRPKGDLVLDA